MASWKPPRLEKHVRGQARVRYLGKDYWLGPWGPDPVPRVEVLQADARLLAHLEEQFHARAAGVVEPVDPDRLSMCEAVLLYLDHMRNDLDGAKRVDGGLTSSYERARQAGRVLAAMFGDTFADAFFAKDLKTCRDAIKRGSWWVDGMSGKRPGPVRSTSANRRMGEIVRMFEWLESEALVSAGRAEHLRTVRHLPPEPKAPRGTVPDPDFEAVLPFCPPPVAALLELQRMTAARPSELLVMRPVDLDTSGRVWVFRPSSHKNAWRDGQPERLIPIGPAAQAVLGPFLVGRGLSEYVFSPWDAWAWQVGYRRGSRPVRQTTQYPGEVRRVAIARKKAARRRGWSDRYTRDTYRRSISRAIQRAVAVGIEIAPFCPYAIRHTRITEVQRRDGWEAGAAVAGHASPNMTARYAHQSQERALEIAASASAVGSARVS